MSGIYIHIPFCKQACYYCDFHFSTSLKKKQELISALVNELELRKEEIKEPVETIYFGGGTPSILTIEELQLLIDTVYQNYAVSKDPEITLEANPDDLIEASLSVGESACQSGKKTETIFECYRAIGINRLSIGIQSFFEDDLKNMNRAHNAKEAKQCLKEATRYFNNITIDLIYGIPRMSLEKWDKNLEQAFNFGINHISSYALTVEPKTALDNFIKKGTYPPLDEDLALQHFNHLVERTNEKGFVQYEISNFGKPDYFSKHNTSYWQGKPYLGIGPSAHSFNENERSWNVSNNTKYIQAIQKGEFPRIMEPLTIADRFNEYVMTGLRTIWGISLDKIETHFGSDYLQHLKVSAKKYIDEGLLVTSTEHGNMKSYKYALKTTPKGKFLVDGIASELFVI